MITNSFRLRNGSSGDATRKCRYLTNSLRFPAEVKIGQGNQRGADDQQKRDRIDHRRTAVSQFLSNLNIAKGSAVCYSDANQIAKMKLPAASGRLIKVE